MRFYNMYLGLEDSTALRAGRATRRVHAGQSLDGGPASGRSCRRTVASDAEGAGRRRPARGVDYIHDPSFDRPDAGARFLGPMPTGPRGAPAGPSPRAARAGDGATPLRPEEEAFLFLRMNYLKCRAAQLREALGPSRAPASALAEIERLHGEARAVKDRIVESNLALVYHHARRRVGAGRIPPELVSEGSLVLMHAVEKFDVSRGFKFSTYASCAIVRSLARTSGREGGRRRRFVTVPAELFRAIADPRTGEPGGEDATPGRPEAVGRMLGRLSDRERGVIVGRFGLEGARQKTLGELGEEMGVTRERVRQIESRAREKLRVFALAEGLDPTAA